MSKKYTLIEAIGSCYNYILKHTDFEPSDDLYQDIAADYIERYNRGTSHQQILSNLVYVYKRRYIRLSKENLPDAYIDPIICDENDLMFETIGKDNIKMVLDAIPERCKMVIYLRYYDNLTYDTIGKIIGVTSGRVQQIERSAIRKLRHHDCRKYIREFYR